MRRASEGRWYGVRQTRFVPQMVFRLVIRLDRWPEAVEAFLMDKRRSCSQGTVETYKGILTGPRTRNWRRAHEVREPGDVTAVALRAFQVTLQEAGLKPETVFTYHKILKTFLRWCREEGHRISPRAASLKGPRVFLTEPRTYTQVEIERVLAATRYPRDGVIIETLLRTGLRVGELCNLTLSDIVSGPDGQYLRVRAGKGGRDRIVPTDTPLHRLSKTLRAYLRDIRPMEDETPCRSLFLTPPQRRAEASYHALTPNAVKIIFRHLHQETGIPIHAHGLRHQWATDSLRAGVDIEALRRAGGWSSYRMIQRYTHYLPSDLLDAWSRRRD